MISLTLEYNRIKMLAPYSTDLSARIKTIQGRKWDYTNKAWWFPQEAVLSIYDAIPEELLSPDEYVQKLIELHNGESLISMRRIAKDVVEVFYPYHKDIADMMRQLIYKHKVSLNHYTVTDDEAKKLIKMAGKERINFLFDKTDCHILDDMGSQIITLDYAGPLIKVYGDYTYINKISLQIQNMTYDYKMHSYTIPLHTVSELVGLVGRPSVNIPNRIMYELEEVVKKEIPVKERLKNIKQAMPHKFKTEPLPHQIEAFNIGIHRPRLLIADSPGLGKTFSALNIATYYSENAMVNKVLIVCGVNSVKYNWQKEIEFHTNEKSVILEGTETKRLKLIDQWLKDENVLFAIINIEALRKEAICEKFNGNVDMIIVDEIHKAKNGQSLQGKALKNLHAKYEIGLSGTPMTNKPEDLWNILTWLGVENRFFKDFRKQYCVSGGFEDKQIIGYQNLDDLSMLLKEVMLRRKKEDVVDLPPKTYQTEYVELSAAQKKDYKDAENGVLQILDEILDTSNPLTHLLRLRQVTSGLFEEEKDNVKLKRCVEMLKESIIPSGDKALIFTQYESIAQKYKDALEEYSPAYIVGAVSPENRQKEVERFQTDISCKVAIGTIGAMGTGLTMTAATYVFFIDKAWAQTDNEQAEDRAHRIGTTENVTIVSMVAKNTIDEHIEEVLKEKADLFENIVEGKAISKESKKELMLKLLGISEKDLNKMMRKAKMSEPISNQEKEPAQEEKK